MIDCRLTSESWVPYHANDVQLEFVMLDPYVRKTMSHNEKGTFTCQFKVCAQQWGLG